MTVVQAVLQILAHPGRTRRAGWLVCAVAAAVCAVVVALAAALAAILAALAWTGAIGYAGLGMGAAVWMAGLKGVHRRPR